MSDIALYRVALTIRARDDLREIASYRAARCGLDDGHALFDAILAAIATLERFPLRGPAPKELVGSGETRVHQTVHGVYRIFYEVVASDVTVFMIADGRRDMQRLLRARLLTRDPPG